MKSYRLENIYPYGLGAQMTLKLMGKRIGTTEMPPHYYKDTVENSNEMAKQLMMRGGFPQQERMVRDKRKSLDKATLYSYQACRIRKVQDKELSNIDYTNSTPVRALINPNKTKFDYDDKVLSIGFEYEFEVGDVFEWVRTNSYWLITLQDLDEIAYFRGDIRRCDYEINWLDDEGNEQHTFAAIRGPVETKINFIQKHQISVDEPNYSLHILMPRNEKTMKAFQRYSKFYLKTADSPDNNICWRVEATDSISTKGILEITAVEYYANKDEDDVEKGLVKANIKKIEPEENEGTKIIGETFIKPKTEVEFYINSMRPGTWRTDKVKGTVTLEPYVNEDGYQAVKLKWNTAYSGQFELIFKNNHSNIEYSKVIVVESLF